MRNPPCIKIVTKYPNSHTYPNSHRFLVSQKCDYLEAPQYLMFILLNETWNDRVLWTCRQGNSKYLHTKLNKFLKFWGGLLDGQLGQDYTYFRRKPLHDGQKSFFDHGCRGSRAVPSMISWVRLYSCLIYLILGRWDLGVCSGAQLRF